MLKIPYLAHVRTAVNKLGCEGQLYKINAIIHYQMRQNWKMNGKRNSDI